MNFWKFDANGIQILYNDIFKKNVKRIILSSVSSSGGTLRYS